MSITRTAAVGALSLVAAGAIGGGFALAMSGQGDTPRPTELRQVVQTTTTPATVTTTTTTASPTATTTTTPAKVTTTTRKASVAPRVQQAAPEPSASSSDPAPEPVTPTPTGTTTLRQPPPVIPGNGPRICGTTVCPTE